jgi:hypothetical protein
MNSARIYGNVVAMTRQIIFRDPDVAVVTPMLKLRSEVFHAAASVRADQKPRGQELFAFARKATNWIEF